MVANHIPTKKTVQEGPTDKGIGDRQLSLRHRPPTIRANPIKDTRPLAHPPILPRALLGVYLTSLIFKLIFKFSIKLIVKVT